MPRHLTVVIILNPNLRAQYCVVCVDRAIVGDCIEGALISSSVIITFLGLMALRDYLIAHSLLREQVGRPVRAEAVPAPNPGPAQEDAQFPDFRGWEGLELLKPTALSCSPRHSLSPIFFS